MDLRARRTPFRPDLRKSGMRPIGIVLIVLGLLALASGGINYWHADKALVAGPFQATADRGTSFPMPPVAGGIALVAGIGIFAVGGSRRLA